MKKFKMYSKWLALALVGSAVIFASTGCGSDASKAPAADTEAKAETEAPAAEAEAEPAAEEAYVNTAKDVELFAGDFVVGKDIVEGRYVVTTEEKAGTFIVYDSEGLPVTTEVLGTATEMLAVEKIELDLFEGQKVSVTGINKVQLKPATIEAKTELTAGTYLVGRDVPVGDYVATTEEKGGAFIVYDSNGLPKVSEILGKGDLGVEKIKVSLKDGDVLQLCNMNKVTLGQ